MTEPIYLAQNGDPMTPEERTAWIKARSGEAHKQGCTHLRASVDPDGLTLLEGWETRPESEGDPRFQYQAA